jgi:hypothetical protein
MVVLFLEVYLEWNQWECTQIYIIILIYIILFRGISILETYV